MEKTEEKREISYFDAPVSNTKPAGSVSLAGVYQMIVSGGLRQVTESIRTGKAEKMKVLPSVTFSGTFSRRSKTGLLEHSNLIVFDIDNLDFASTLKWRISIDVFLKVVLAFISPGGKGLKFVVRIQDGKPEDHGHYFRAVALYVKTVFGIPVDESGKETCRLCFLCHDPAAHYNPVGHVTAEALLRLLPKEESDPVQTRQCLVSTPEKTAAAGRDAINRVSTHKTTIPAETDQICERLNSLPEVIQRAFSALYKAGWKRIRGTDYLSRPGGKPGKVSAVFNWYEAEKRMVFTNFSSNGLPFETRGYSPLGVICELEFNGDFEACLADLAEQYPETC